MTRRRINASILGRLAPLVVAATLLGPATVFAHDMWIEPTTFAPEPGQVVGLRFRVGENLVGEVMPRDPSLVREFVVEDASGRRAVYGRDGSDPAGLLRVAGPGLLVVGYFSNPSIVEMPAEKFNRYLEEEGLDAVRDLRVRRRQTASGARDRYARCAKALVFTGPAGKAQQDRNLGFPLELVAERNPYTLRDGEDLPVLLTFGGRPLAGALVVAVNGQNPSEKLSARSDADGRVRLRLPNGGVWLIKAVHMVPAPAGANADWDSFWASLTFEAPSTGTPPSR